MELFIDTTAMADVRDKRAAEIQDSIRQIFLQDWNPIGFPVPDDEYDAYIAPVYRILTGSRSEQELCEFLFQTARDTFGVANDTIEHFELGRSVALKLLELDVSLNRAAMFKSQNKPKADSDRCTDARN